MKRRILSLALLLACAAALAANWPAWRGPTGQGFCDEKNVPLKWSDKENVKWKVAAGGPGQLDAGRLGRQDLPHPGQQGRQRPQPALLRPRRRQAALAEGRRLRREGAELERRPGTATPRRRPTASASSSASARPGMYCYDFDGKELWKRTDLGKWEHAFGNGASPVLYGDLAILWCGPNEGKGRNFLLAVNKKTGETVWEHDETFGSWSTPLIAKVDGQDQLLLGQSRDVKRQPDDEDRLPEGLRPEDRQGTLAAARG